MTRKQRITRIVTRIAADRYPMTRSKLDAVTAGLLDDLAMVGVSCPDTVLPECRECGREPAQIGDLCFDCFGR